MAAFGHRTAVVAGRPAICDGGGELLCRTKSFRSAGAFGARMDQIARTAGVNKALPYYYFRDKEELHRFVLETMIARFCVAMNRQKCLRCRPPNACARW